MVSLPHALCCPLPLLTRQAATHNWALMHPLLLFVACSNGIAGEGGCSLAVLLQNGSAIEDLNLENNRVNDEGAIGLAKALAKNRSLRRWVGGCQTFLQTLL